MKEGTMDVQKFKKKMQKKYTTFVESVDGLSDTDIEKQLSFYAKNREEVNYAKSSDKELALHQEMAKELAAPYSEAVSMLKDKLSYLNILLMERQGKLVEQQEEEKEQ